MDFGLELDFLVHEFMDGLLAEGEGVLQAFDGGDEDLVGLLLLVEELLGDGGSWVGRVVIG